MLPCKHAVLIFQCCDVLSRVEPGSGCGFVHFKLPGSGLVGVQFLWAMRRPLHARIVRMGYNLLALDLDIGLYDDPYKYFKAPPFRDINLMSQVSACRNTKLAAVSAAVATTYCRRSAADRYRNMPFILSHPWLPLPTHLWRAALGRSTGLAPCPSWTTTTASTVA